MSRIKTDLAGSQFFIVLSREMKPPSFLFASSFLLRAALMALYPLTRKERYASILRRPFYLEVSKLVDADRKLTAQGRGRFLGLLGG